MVEGLDVKYSVMLVPITMFCYFTAILNPIIILKCVGDNCRSRMRSEFDDEFDGFDDYEAWRNGSANLQSDGNVTLLKFTHGFVKCDSNCDDCNWQDEASETCDDFNDTAYQLLLEKLEELNATEDDYNYTLPSYLIPDCSCRDWCTECDDSNLVSLPGDGLQLRHVSNYWNNLEEDCDDWELELNSTAGVMCDLYETFYLTMGLTLLAFGWLGIVLALIMFLEYTNFHIFYNGKCKFCFISPRTKRALFTLLLIFPVLFMLYIGMLLRYGNTTEKLTKYFDLVGAEYEYDWVTRGIVMFWISIGLGTLSILVMLCSGTTQRHLRTIANYRRGVEYKGVNWKPHMS